MSDDSADDAIPSRISRHNQDLSVSQSSNSHQRTITNSAGNTNLQNYQPGQLHTSNFLSPPFPTASTSNFDLKKADAFLKGIGASSYLNTAGHYPVPAHIPVPARTPAQARPPVPARTLVQARPPVPARPPELGRTQLQNGSDLSSSARSCHLPKSDVNAQAALSNVKTPIPSSPFADNPFMMDLDLVSKSSSGGISPVATPRTVPMDVKNKSHHQHVVGNIRNEQALTPPCPSSSSSVDISAASTSASIQKVKNTELDLFGFAGNPNFVVERDKLLTGTVSWVKIDRISGYIVPDKPLADLVDPNFRRDHVKPDVKFYTDNCKDTVRKGSRVLFILHFRDNGLAAAEYVELMNPSHDMSQSRKRTENLLTVSVTRDPSPNEKRAMKSPKSEESPGSSGDTTFFLERDKLLGGTIRTLKRDESCGTINADLSGHKDVFFEFKFCKDEVKVGDKVSYIAVCTEGELRPRAEYVEKDIEFKFEPSTRNKSERRKRSESRHSSSSNSHDRDQSLVRDNKVSKFDPKTGLLLPTNGHDHPKDLSQKAGTSSASVDQSGSNTRFQNDKKPTVKPVVKSSVTAKVVTILNDKLFAKPMEALPEGYTQKDVMVLKDRLRPFEFFIGRGDELEVFLGTRDKTSPFAIRCKIVRCSDKSVDVVSNTLKNCTAELQNCSDLPERSLFEKFVEFIRVSPVWDAVGNCDQITFPMFIVAIQLFSKLADICSRALPDVKEFFNTILSSKLFHPIRGTCMRYSKSFRSSEDSLSTKALQEFFSHVINYAPQKCKKLLKLVEAVFPDDSFWITCIKQLICTTTSTTELDFLEWNELPRTPVVDELVGTILENTCNLSEVRVGVAYESTDHYLDTYVRLLREDCFHALKDCIKKLLKNELDMRDMNVYPNVSFEGFIPSENGISLMFTFEKKYFHRKLLRKNDMQFGNLLCISPMGLFRDPIWVTSLMRDDDFRGNKLRFAVELCSFGNEMQVNDVLDSLALRSGSLRVVESPTYFKAYEPVLNALQSCDIERFPFQEELVSLDKRGFLPEYLEDGSAYVDSSIVFGNMGRVNEHLDVFLDALDQKISPATSFDDSQIDALKIMFKNRVAIVQGPPGCGKTYIGVHFLRILFTVSSLPKGPVLVLTYKNHALDEFVLDIMSHVGAENICRVGGRSDEPKLEPASLQAIRANAQKTKHFGPLRAQIYEKRQILEECEVRLVKELQSLQKSISWSAGAFVKNSLSTDQIEALLRSRDINIPGSYKFRSIKPGKIMTKQHVSDFLQTLSDDMQDNGIVDFKMAFETDAKIDSIMDFKTLVKAAVAAWLPSSKFISEVEQEFSFNDKTVVGEVVAEDPVDKVRPDGKNPEDDDEEDEERVTAAHSRAAFKSMEEFQKNINILPNLDTDNTSKIPPALQVLSFAKRLCDSSSATLLDTQINLWEMSERCRLIGVQAKLLEASRENYSTCHEVYEEYTNVCKEKAFLEHRLTADVIGTRKVIAMTITGASIHKGLIDLLQPPIIIVEEAAEVMEPQLMAILGPHVQHLVMIGDHKQLSPPVQSYNLIKKYKFDISLMERLIKGKLPYATLKCQNRMRPSISKYLLDIYPKLKDGPRVTNIPKVTCMTSDVFFWSHSSPEVSDRSFTNEEEVDRALQLACFFITQQYEPKQITILSSYRGQTALMRRKLDALQAKQTTLFPEKLARDQNIQVHTIDMYQGDENDIVIVSLVRSNNKGLTGFVKALNRRCVAQSRAKRGVVFIGNSETIDHAEHWRPFLGMLKHQGFLDTTIVIQCPRHSNVKVAVKDSKTFPSPNFCTEMCGEDFPCQIANHACRKVCQPMHSHAVCEAKVSYVDRSKCFHPRTKPCWKDAATIECKVACPMKFPACAHPCIGHCEPKHTHVKCNAPVSYHCTQCRGNLERKCWEDAKEIKCKAEVPVQCSVCKKNGKRSCHMPQDSYQCKNKCVKTLPCSHSCKNHCYQPCTKECLMDVEVACGTCKVPGKKKCHEDFNKYKCMNKCVKILACKHPCQRLCSETCTLPDACKHCQEVRKAAEEIQRKQLVEQGKQAIKRYEKEIREAKANGVPVCRREQMSPNDGETAADYLRVEDLVLKYVQSDHKWFPAVTAIEKVTNLELTLKFYQAISKLNDPDVTKIVEKFHGTSKEATDAIVKTGFLLPQKGGMYGKGVYLASDSSKSAQEIYTKGSKMLLLCKAALGRSKTVNNAQPNASAKTLKRDNCDSLFAKRGTKGSGGVLFDEFVVFDPNQVLPAYIIHYNVNSFTQVPRIAGAPPGGGYRKTQLKLTRSGSDPIGLHYRAAAAQFHLLSNRQGYKGPQSIKSIYLHENSILQSKFDAECRKMQGKYPGQEDGDHVLAFHGTPNMENIDKIAKENFRMDKISRGAYGWGIYFSEFPDTSLGYAGATQTLLLCKILPGKSRDGDCHQTRPGARCPCDSHRVDKQTDNRGQMIVMFDVDRILPCYELHLG